MTLLAGSNSRRRRRGFTVTELMVVMVIMVLLAALAAPRFVGSMRSERLRTAGRMMVTTVELARSRSVSGAVLTQLSFDYENSRMVVSRYVQDTEDGEPTEPYWEPLTDNLGQARELPAGVTIRYVGDEPSMTSVDPVEELIFRPDGSTDEMYIVLEGFEEEILVVDVDDIRFMPRVLDISSLDELAALEMTL